MDGWANPQPTYEWNPSTQEFTSSTAPAAIFCSGLAQLPNGDVMTVGGYGLPTTGQLGLTNTAVFNPQTGQWSSLASMHAPRWYPSVTELANGKYVAISGNSTNATTWADTPEVYDPSANTWTALSRSPPRRSTRRSTPSRTCPQRRSVHHRPVRGRLLRPQRGQRNLDVGGLQRDHERVRRSCTGPARSSTPAGRPASQKDHRPPTRGDHRPDGSDPDNGNRPRRWATARIYHTLTTLADGTVLAIGGETSSDQSIVTSGVLPTEIWNPTTETWTPAAPIAVARNYHSTAILLPDGRCCGGWGTHHRAQRPGRVQAQIYSPPYLFKGPRPTITAAPPPPRTARRITVSTPDAARSAR